MDMVCDVCDVCDGIPFGNLHRDTSNQRRSLPTPRHLEIGLSLKATFYIDLHFIYTFCIRLTLEFVFSMPHMVCVRCKTMGFLSHNDCTSGKSVMLHGDVIVIKILAYTSMLHMLHFVCCCITDELS